MDDKYLIERETYTDDNGNEIEINRVVYERDNGEVDFVEQTKENGREIGHHTEHPDGTVHDYGIYEKNDRQIWRYKL